MVGQPLKPRISRDPRRGPSHSWRCTGPLREWPDGEISPAFPWAYGPTPEAAYTAWKKLQKRPPAPTMDEHASNPGAAT